MSKLLLSYFSTIFDDIDIRQVYAQELASDQEQSQGESKFMQDKTAAVRWARSLTISYHSH